MRKSRYSDSQILSILKQNENGVSVPDLCREHGMSTAMFYKWRAKFGVAPVQKRRCACVGRLCAIAVSFFWRSERMARSVMPSSHSGCAWCCLGPE